MRSLKAVRMSPGRRSTTRTPKGRSSISSPPSSALNAAFPRTIVAAEGQWHFRGQRTDPHDGAGAAWAHVRGGQAQEMQRPVHQDPPLVRGFLGRHLLERAEDAGAGVLDENIDVPRFVQRLPPRGVDGGGLLQFEREGMDVRALRHARGVAGSGPDVVPALRQEFRRGAADAGTRAGEEDVGHRRAFARRAGLTSLAGRRGHGRPPYFTMRSRSCQ